MELAGQPAARFRRIARHARPIRPDRQHPADRLSPTYPAVLAGCLRYNNKSKRECHEAGLRRRIGSDSITVHTIHELSLEKRRIDRILSNLHRKARTLGYQLVQPAEDQEVPKRGMVPA